ncbi:hypothetical protein [Streptomyces marincola]|uniref:hypothetical protein n=1 Tax=Streptomyces marincola TaxID=2878388 RepID=UPI001CF0D9BB|nr:hypothetical protein [Streptomyces marincola]UCM87991.1 hypothetical protein LC193_08490 [Streptomyces marincola]
MYPPMPPPPSPGARGSAPPGPAGRRWKAVALVTGAVALALAVLAFALTRERAPEQAPADHAPSASPSPSADPPRGEATAAARGATRRVSGLPRGFARTATGAVEASASYLASIDDLYRMTSFERWRYARDAVVDPPSVTTLDADAAAALADGSAADCRPDLGAYRVVASSPDRAVVDHWMPCLAGPDPALGGTEARARWLMGRAVLKWEGADWRVAELLRGPFDQLVTPADPDQPVVPLAERLALLGAGWELYADATERLRPAASPDLTW